MKATIHGVEVEGTAEEIYGLISKLSKTESQADASILTPAQRNVYDELAKHPDGAHYSAVAEGAGKAVNATNSMLNYLVTHYPKLVERTGHKGCFRAK